MFFTKKKKTKQYLTRTICALTILSLFLQFLPAFQLARAEEKKSFFQKAEDWLVKLTEKVALPDISLTEQGQFKVGPWPLLKAEDSSSPWAG